MGFPVKFKFEDGNAEDGTPTVVFVVSLDPGDLRFPFQQEQVDTIAAAWRASADRLRTRLILPPGVDGRSG